MSREKYSKVFHNPPMSEIMKMANDEDAVIPTWTSTRHYSRIDIDNSYWAPNRTTTLWEDEQSGIVTADPQKFEKWLEGLKS